MSPFTRSSLYPDSDKQSICGSWWWHIYNTVTSACQTQYRLTCLIVAFFFFYPVNGLKYNGCSSTTCCKRLQAWGGLSQTHGCHQDSEEYLQFKVWQRRTAWEVCYHFYLLINFQTKSCAGTSLWRTFCAMFTPGLGNARSSPHFQEKSI